MALLQELVPAQSAVWLCCGTVHLLVYTLPATEHEAPLMGLMAAQSTLSSVSLGCSTIQLLIHTCTASEALLMGLMAA